MQPSAEIHSSRVRAGNVVSAAASTPNSQRAEQTPQAGSPLQNSSGRTSVEVMTLGSLSRERWAVLEPLLDAALELEPTERPAFGMVPADTVLAEFKAVLALSPRSKNIRLYHWWAKDGDTAAIQTYRPW